MEENIKCPLCGGSKSISFFCEKNNYKLYNCFLCRLNFVSPMPIHSDDIYQEEYFKKDKSSSNNFGYVDYEKDKEPMRKTFNQYLEKIEQLTAGRKLFDLGAATGYFLDLAKTRSWQTAGAEISGYAARLAREKGHYIFVGRLEASQIKNEYDVVTMWDVLEHLDSPKIDLKTINIMLKEGGLVAINTIDQESFWARIWGKRWQAIIPPEHLFYYSAKSLKILLAESGFKILMIKKIGKSFSLSYIFKILYNWQGLEIWNKLSNYFGSRFWRRFALPINLKDNIFVVARKVRPAA